MNTSSQNKTSTKVSWYVAGTGNHQGLVIDEMTGANIAVVYDKKDAPLIAAAPELLEALQKLAPILDNDGPLVAAYADIEPLVRAAIARATQIQPATK